MHEHKGTNLAKLIMAPEILLVGDIENATAQGWKESRETPRIIKRYFLTSEKGNLEFGTEIECQVLFW